LEKRLGPYHVDVARSLSHVGTALYELERYAEALAAHDLAQPIYEKTLGRHHVDVATSLNNIGTALCGLGRYSEALSAIQLAKRIFLTAYGLFYPHTATTLIHEATCHAHLQRLDDALRLYGEAKAVLSQLHGASSVPVLQVLLRIVGLQARTNERDASFSLREAERISRHHDGACESEIQRLVAETVGRGYYHSGDL
jgi:serine/threonine-protein kinase